MKKVLIMIQFFLLIAFSSQSYALEGQGKIVEVKTCGTGGTAYGWYNHVFFKLSDGNWFAFPGNNENRMAESNFNHSIVLMAFSMNLDVEVSATYSVINFCNTSASVLFNKSTDSLRVVRE